MSGKHTNNSKRIEELLQLFSEENAEVRNTVARILPSYNTLLSLHAITFEEFSLLPLARKQGLNYKDPLFSFRTVMPPCPKCGEEKRVYRLGENSYRCRNCNGKYAANQNSISSGAKVSSLTWMRVLHCMLEFYSVKRTCAHCDISPMTYYNIRNRLFYAMQIMLEDVKLYGVIQCDNAFVHSNFKGASLDDEDYPEDTPLYRVNFLPRKAKQRGGSQSHKENVTNALCLFSAIDDFGHSLVRYAGLGNATATKLYRHIPSSKYLLEIPEKDPFSLTFHSPTHKSVDGTKSLLVADKETAIEKYASFLGINYETHVFRKNNTQVVLGKDAHNIQKINALHKRLKDFFRKTNYVSSKYLPGFLVLFDFIENTGATTEAIGRLFEIISTPGLGQPQSFYKNLFSVPNYIIDWANDNSLIKHVPYNQALAAYLYYEKTINHNTKITIENIMEQTGYQSGNAIRRVYKNFVSSGVMNAINTAIKNGYKVSADTNNTPIELYVSGGYNVYIKLYDLLCDKLLSCSDEYINYPSLRLKAMAELNITLSVQNVEKHLQYINANLRSYKLSELRKHTANGNRRKKNETQTNDAMTVYNRIQELINEFKRENRNIPPIPYFYRVYADEAKMSIGSVEKLMIKARKQIKKEANKKLGRN